MLNKIKMINDYIITKNKFFYNDIYNIVNPTLSRNPYISNFLNYYLGYKKIKKVTFIKKCNLLAKYFLFFYIRYAIYICKYVIYKLYIKKNNIDNKDQYNYLIDVNFLLQDILLKGKFEDRYLKNLNLILEKNGYKIAYIVKSFFGYEFSLIKFYYTIKVLNRSNKKIVCEFDFLRPFDLIKIFIFGNRYPFKLLSLKVKEDKFIDTVFNVSNIEALKSSAYTRYVRYLTGQYIGKLFNDVKIISHCEYKCHDKIFYKGIKDINRNIYIYGCQFFIDYPVWLNTKIPKEEISFNVTPDLVLVNGISDFQKHTIKTKLGASLRYDSLFKNDIIHTLNMKNTILILLSFFHEISENILKVCSKSEFLDKNNVIIRVHPAFNINNISKDLLKKEWIIDNNESLDIQFTKCDIVIVSGSGTALEAVCKEKSVIIIDNKNTFLTNPLSNTLGKGIIWDIASDAYTLDKKINLIYDKRKTNYNEIKLFAKEYLKSYFTEPSEENIMKSFNNNNEEKR